MSLTAYEAIAPNLSKLYAPSTFSGVLLTPTASSFTFNLQGLINVNDYLVMMIGAQGITSDATALTASIGGSNRAFTKIYSSGIGFGVWILQNIWVPVSNVSVTVTYASTTYGQYHYGIVKNASGFTVGAGNSASSVASGTAMNLGSVTGSTANSLLMGIWGCRQSSSATHTAVTFTPTYTSVFPGSLAVYLSTNGNSSAATTNGIGVGLVACTNETPCSSGTPAFVFTSSGTVDYGGCLIRFAGTNVSLDDLTLQFGSSGPLLNNPSGTLPIYDVDTIVGLTDFNVTNSIDSVDGADGSYVSAKYAEGKTIVIDGTIYAAAPFDEALLDNIKQACKVTGVNVDIPLFFKPLNKNPRVINSRPIVVKSDIDRGRALSAVAFEIQALTEDSIATGLAPQVLPFTTTQISVTPVGSRECFPIIYFALSSADVNGLGDFVSLKNDTWAALQDPTVSSGIYNGVIIDCSNDQTLIGAGLYKLDFGNRTLQMFQANAEPLDVSSGITTRNWWSVVAGLANIITLTKHSSATTNDLLVVDEAWL